MMARFLPGVRAVTYFVAGTTGVPYWKFILYDGIAACASAPGWVLLGHWAGRHRMLRKAWHWAKEVQIGAILVVLGILALWITVAWIRRRIRESRTPTLSALPGGRAAESEPARRVAGKRSTEA
jgi:membrane protein DedA with SNARE-associated domain